MQEKQREPSWRRGVSRARTKQLLASLCFLGFSFPTLPCSPLCTPDTHMHMHMAGMQLIPLPRPPTGLSGDDSGPTLPLPEERLAT